MSQAIADNHTLSVARSDDNEQRANKPAVVVRLWGYGSYAANRCDAWQLGPQWQWGAAKNRLYPEMPI